MNEYYVVYAVTDRHAGTTVYSDFMMSDVEREYGAEIVRDLTAQLEAKYPDCRIMIQNVL